MKDLIAQKTKKFSFSKKPNTVSIAEQDKQKVVVEAELDYEFPQGAYVLHKITNQKFVPQETEEKDVYLYDLESCVVDLCGIKVAAIHARNLSKCFIISNPIGGSFLGHACIDSKLILGCKQFRIHDSKNVVAFLLIPSDPIIEDCTEMIFGKYTLEIEDGWYKSIHNQFEQVKDFNWHKKDHSPNWKLAQESDYAQAKN
jgi:hypothetical protein